MATSEFTVGIHSIHRQKKSFAGWWSSGEPWIWLTATTVGFSVVAVLGLLGLIAMRGLSHFWPADIEMVTYQELGSQATILGELEDSEEIPVAQYVEAYPSSADLVNDSTVVRLLYKTGNRRVAAPDFRWVDKHSIESRVKPENVVVLERTEWGNAYGFLESVAESAVDSSESVSLSDLMARIHRVNGLRDEIETLQDDQVNKINYELERLRLERRRLQLSGVSDFASIEAEEKQLRTSYVGIEANLRSLYEQMDRDTITLRLADGSLSEISLSTVLRAWNPNSMALPAKLGHYFTSVWAFLTEDPREANTEGGVFPALFGTVLMVLLMSVMVTPFGVIAAVYLREYARQGPFVRLVRIAVNNLAGVPSVVFGVFGLGFFVYFVGGTIDDLFFEAAKPAPTFGTPGLIWASLTLALLTVPVVIVSTEEGLTRIPRDIRAGSLALGATKAETLMRVILPMATPSILTGMILAIARAAGEVAPLMLVGVVKLAPTLPIDGNFPYLHLERKFMHLGFHIYDVGFQSPNVDAARPLVFATAFLLVLIVIALNLLAITLRNRLEKRFRGVPG